jgi:hypothetical protein
MTCPACCRQTLAASGFHESGRGRAQDRHCALRRHPLDGPDGRPRPRRRRRSSRPRSRSPGDAVTRYEGVVQSTGNGIRPLRRAHRVRLRPARASPRSACGTTFAGTPSGCVSRREPASRSGRPQHRRVVVRSATSRRTRRRRPSVCDRARATHGKPRQSQLRRRQRVDPCPHDGSSTSSRSGRRE